VEGEGFKIDSTRLTMHSEFLYNMLHNDLDIGASQEGTVDNPIVVLGCSKETFANFMLWLNHKSVRLFSLLNVIINLWFTFPVLGCPW
jgi:hypothetical protein